MSDRLLGLSLLALAAAFGISAHGIEVPFAYEPVGPRAFPMLLAALLALGALYCLVRPDSEPEWPRGVLAIKQAACLATFIGYGWLFQSLGFIVSTGLACAVIAVLFGGRPLQAVATGAGLGVGFFLFFDKLLDVVLPRSPLLGF